MHCPHQRVDVRLGAARRDDLPDVLVEADQADRVLLPQEQVRQAGGDRAAVLVLGEGAAAVAHRLADVHDQRRPQVGLGLELLDVKAVGLAPDLPVEVAEVVAADVLAVLDELDRVAEEPAFVHAGDEPLDHLLGAEVEPAGAGDCRRVEEAARVVEVAFVRHGSLRRRITTESQRTQRRQGMTCLLRVFSLCPL